MPFGIFEGSRASGIPVDLYMFRYGSQANAYYSYTDAEDPVVYDGIEYQPIPIQRGDISSSGTLDKSALSITVPISAGIAGLFRVYPPSQPVTAIIRQGHLNDPDAEFLAAWSGRIIQCERDESEATLTCEPIATSMRRAGLRRHYQIGCPHVLYGPQCRANQLAATIVREAFDVEATKITLPDGWYGEIDPVKYIGGMVSWTTAAGTERRTILRVTDLRTLSLAGPTTGLVNQTNVEVTLGCNHRIVFDEDGNIDVPQSDCVGLHNNVHNYGGQPWIPLSNPINTNPFS